MQGANKGRGRARAWRRTMQGRQKGRGKARVGGLPPTRWRRETKRARERERGRERERERERERGGRRRTVKCEVP